MSVVNATDFVWVVVTHAFWEWLSVKVLPTDRLSIRIKKIFAVFELISDSRWSNGHAIPIVLFWTIRNAESIFCVQFSAAFCLALVFDGVKCERMNWVWIVVVANANWWAMTFTAHCIRPRYSLVVINGRSRANNFPLRSSQPMNAFCMFGRSVTILLLLLLKRDFSFGFFVLRANKPLRSDFLTESMVETMPEMELHSITCTCMPHDAYMLEWSFLFCCRRIIKCSVV